MLASEAVFAWGPPAVSADGTLSVHRANKLTSNWKVVLRRGRRWVRWGLCIESEGTPVKWSPAGVARGLSIDL